MTKFILILHLCSFLNEPICFQSTYLAEFTDHYSCVRNGYIQAYKSLETLTVEEINKKELAIKIQCKKINIKGKKI